MNDPVQLEGRFYRVRLNKFRNLLRGHASLVIVLRDLQGVDIQGHVANNLENSVQPRLLILLCGGHDEIGPVLGNNIKSKAFGGI